MDAAAIYHRRCQAMIDFEYGKLPEAEKQLNKLITEIGSPQTRQMKQELCQCRIDLATIYRFENRWDEALADLTTCEKDAQELGLDVRNMILTVIYIIRAKVYATPYSSVYNPEESLKSLAELRKLGWNDWVADQLESDLAFRDGKWDRAAMLALRAAGALASKGWLRGAASCRLRAGKACLELRNLQQAEIELTAAHKFFIERGPPDQLAETQLGLARLKSSRGEHDDAWNLASKALDCVESLIRHFRELYDQQRFLIDKLRYYDYAFDIGLAKGGVDGWQRTWTIAERAKSFYLCQLLANADISLFEGVDPVKIKNLKDLEMQLDDYEQKLRRLNDNDKNGDRGSKIEEQLLPISRKRQELLNNMMQENSRWAALKVPPKIDLNAELKKLDPAWVPISYFWRENWNPEDEGANLYIFYAGQDRIPQCTVVPWSKQELTLLDDCREKLQGMPKPSTPVFPKELTEKVFPKKVLNVFEVGQRLLISPHGGLRNIPLHAIDIGKEDYIINKWPTQYLPTFTLLPLRRHGTRPDSVMLMGCPENAFGGELLKKVYDEIDELYGMWSARRPNRVKKSIIPVNGSPEQAGFPMETWYDYEILHFACHGEFPEKRPFDAALLLGKDAIRASELFTIRLRAALVSLSACELGHSTGHKTNHHSKGNMEEFKFVGDEWVGLYIPLFYSGAERLLVSLWKADMKRATQFMKTLHGALSEGRSPDVAFQKATISVKNYPATLWANWYLVGLPE